MLHVHIRVGAIVFAPGARIEKQPRSVEFVEFFFDLSYIVRASLFYLVTHAIHAQRRVIEVFIYGFFEKFFGNDRSARRYHLFEVIVNIVRRAEFDVYEYSRFVGCLKQLFFGYDGMKPYEIEAEFFGFFKVFGVEFFKRQSRKVCVVVRLCPADKSAYVQRLSVEQNIFGVRTYFAETEFAR